MSDSGAVVRRRSAREIRPPAGAAAGGIRALAAVAAVAAALAVLAAPARGAPDGSAAVTIRAGEQDTCTLRDVTSGEGRTIRFDLSALDKDTRILKAELRYWVSPRAKDAAAYRFDAYDAEGFDGVKVWAGPPEGEPLDTVYPFNIARHGLVVFDVTDAVAAWVKDPASNKGLTAGVALPAARRGPAWMRPYLQITCAGAKLPPGAPKPPAQPSGLTAACRDGQVFLTWKQPAHAGAFFDSTFRIYRHTSAITAANLDRAERVGEVHRLSQLNHRRTLVSLAKRYGCRDHYARAGVELPDRFNFCIDPDWAEGKDWAADFKALREDREKYARGGTILHQGPQLTDETGLFVRTARKAGRFHYAVTRVLCGNENRRDFGNGNTAVVDQKVADPQPVLQAVFNCRKNRHGHYYQYREYVLWSDERFHNVAGEPLCFLAVLSADPRRTPQIGVKDFDKAGFRGWAHLSVMLNGYSSHYWHNLPRIGMKLDTNYIPATPRAPFPPNAAVNMAWAGYDRYYYGSAAPPAEAGKARGWRQGFIEPYGYVDTFNTTADARRATVQPYLERMARWMVAWANARLPFNPKRWTLGDEMGPLVVALHSGDLFAAADVSQCYDWAAPRAVGDRRAAGRPEGAGGHQVLAGLRRWGLKNDRGVNVWEWNSVAWYAERFPERPWPVMTHLQSTNYAGGEWWASYNLPEFYLTFPSHKRYIDGWWIHCGDCPRGNMVHVELDEPRPAFANCNISDDIRKAPHKVRRGSLFGYISWSRRGAPLRQDERAIQRGRAKRIEGEPELKPELVDEPERFRMAFRINRQTTHVNYSRQAGPTRARYGMTDITLRRVRNFKVVEGRKYRWTNRRAHTGQYLQTGVIAPDAHGLLTVKGFFIDRHPYGNVLTVVPEAGQGPLAVPKDGKVGELTYDEYVRRCKDPDLHLTVRAPKTTFVTAEIGLGNTYKGGDEWGGQMSETFHFPAAGTYKLSVRAKGRFGLGWPMMGARVGTWRGEPQVVDHTDWHEYTWYGIPVTEGLHDVVLQCVNGYYYRRGLAGNAIRSRRTTIEAIAFARTDDVPAGRPAEVRLAPRHVEVPAGMPVRLTATVLDAAGKRIADAGIKWSATGGKITGEGVSAILAAGKGACVVSAKAGDVTETAPIKVGDRFWADFDTGSLRGWEPIDLGKEPSQWAALWGGNAPPLQSLRQKDPAAASALLWAPAALWTDYDAAADVIYAVGRGALGGGGAVGLAVRASGDGHYRLELDRAGGKARFIRRTAAGEKVLAETDRLPPKADLDPFTNAISRAYHTPEAKKAGKEPLKGWQVDRVRIRCKGDRFTVGVNGKDLFGGPVTDGALTAGAFGPFASGAYYFDNVEVRPAE